MERNRVTSLVQSALMVPTLLLYIVSCSARMMETQCGMYRLEERGVSRYLGSFVESKPCRAQGLDEIDVVGRRCSPVTGTTQAVLRPSTTPQTALA